MAKKKQKLVQVNKDKHSLNKESGKDRRSFLKTTWKYIGMIAGLEFSGLTLHYLNDISDNNRKSDLFDAGLADDFPKNSVTRFRMGHFFLVRFDDSGFIALSNKCSHLGCSVIWNEKNINFECPCHASHFDILGNVTKSPAPRALSFYNMKIENGRLYVDLNKLIKRDYFIKSQLTYV